MKIIPFIIFLVIYNYSFSQEVITGRSRPKKFDFKTAYNKNAPPDLYVDLNFFDENNNNVVEPNEKANINLTVHNRGNGPAQGLVVTLDDQTNDNEIEMPSRREVSFVFPGKSIDINIPITAKSGISSLEHKVEIKLKDFYDYEIDPAYLVFNTYKQQLKNIAINSYKIPDFYVITGRVINKKLQSNSFFKVDLNIKNTGQIETGPISFVIESNNNNLKFEFPNNELKNIGIGEEKSISFSISNSSEIDIYDGISFAINATDDSFQKLLNDVKLNISLERLTGGTKTFPINLEAYNFLEKEARFEYESKKYNDFVGKIYDIRNIKNSFTSKPEDISIIVGVERYKSLTTSIHSVNDALIFRSYGQKVLGINKSKIFTNKEFTDTIFNNLVFSENSYVKNNIKAGKSNIFIYYSGHTLTTASGDDIYLTSYECNLNTLHSCSAKLSDLISKLNELDPNSINIILESTLNGKTKSTPVSNQETINPNANNFNIEGFKNKTNTSKLNILFASESQQTPLTFQPSSTGLMSYFLFAGMQGHADENGNKIISIDELFKYTKTETENASGKLNGIQTPVYIINKNIELLEY
jgi:hypothetical protein